MRNEDEERVLGEGHIPPAFSAFFYFSDGSLPSFPLTPLETSNSLSPSSCSRGLGEDLCHQAHSAFLLLCGSASPELARPPKDPPWPGALCLVVGVTNTYWASRTSLTIMSSLQTLVVASLCSLCFIDIIPKSRLKPCQQKLLSLSPHYR